MKTEIPKVIKLNFKNYKTYKSYKTRNTPYTGAQKRGWSDHSGAADRS